MSIIKETEKTIMNVACERNVYSAFFLNEVSPITGLMYTYGFPWYVWFLVHIVTRTLFGAVFSINGRLNVNRTLLLYVASCYDQYKPSVDEGTPMRSVYTILGIPDDKLEGKVHIARNFAAHQSLPSFDVMNKEDVLKMLNRQIIWSIVFEIPRWFALTTFYFMGVMFFVKKLLTPSSSSVIWDPTPCVWAPTSSSRGEKAVLFYIPYLILTIVNSLRTLIDHLRIIQGLRKLSTLLAENESLVYFKPKTRGDIVQQPEVPQPQIDEEEEKTDTL